MKILNTKINGFGKFENKEINFSEGINVVVGRNESGKSTLLEYINSMFFGASKNKRGKEVSTLEKYTPWNAEEYSGELEYKLDNGKKYTIFREFKKSKCKIFDGDLADITKQFSVEKTNGNMFFYEQTKIDEEMLNSTAVSRQEEVKLTDKEQKQLTSKLTNIVQTGEETVSFKKTIDKLNKKLMEEVGTERSSGRPINIINKNINECIERLKEADIDKQSYDNIFVEIKNLKLDEKQLKLEIDAIKEIKNIKEKEEIQKQVNNVKGKRKKENKINKLSIALFVIVAILIGLGIFINNEIKYILYGLSIVCLGLAIVNLKKKSKREEIVENKENNENTYVLSVYNKFYGKISKEYIQKLMLYSYEKVKNVEQDVQDRINETLLKIHKAEFNKSVLDKKLENITALQEKLEVFKEEKEKLLQKEEYIKMAIEGIEEAYEKMKKQIVPSITQELSEYIKVFTDNNYEQAFFSDDKGIQLKLSNGDMADIKSLSTGTIYQIYLALRVATYKKVCDTQETVPILLDEAFAYFDLERLKTTLFHMQELSKTNQVIIFSCNSREKDMLEQLGIEFNLITL